MRARLTLAFLLTLTMFVVQRAFIYQKSFDAADKTNPKTSGPTSEHRQEEAVPPGPPLDLYISGVVLPWTDEEKMLDQAREHADE
jgi:hypothetical protein